MQFGNGITSEVFLSDYWQKKPLLVRNAFENFQPLITAQELAGLSLEEEIESRLVVETTINTSNDKLSQWTLKKGPFEEQHFQQLPEDKWTLLVQAVDHWLPEAADFLEQFNFIPSWRRDDLMISYATDGGSVGPHYDQYDVFLIQAEGQREWRLGQYCEEGKTELVANANLKLIKHFEEQERWVLNPGDMLYLPPGFAHWGIAIGECQTYSVGFRAPSVAELLDRIIDNTLPELSDSKRFRDRLSGDKDTGSPLEAIESPSKIDKQTINTIRDLLVEQLSTDDAIASMFGHLMTEPKYPEYAPHALTEEENELTWQEFMQEIQALEPPAQLVRDEHARFAYFEQENSRTDSHQQDIHHSDKGIYFFYQGEKQILANEDKDLAELLGKQRYYDANQLISLAKSDNAKTLLAILWASKLIYH